MSKYFNLTHEYTKTRRTFGRQPLFQNVSAHMVDSIPEDKSLQKMYILRNPVHRACQATVPQSEHTCNTKYKKMVETSMNHVEGGWPRDVHWECEELVKRHERRVRHEDGYVQAVCSAAPVIQHYLDQNNAIEMYENYFLNMPKQETVEKYSIKSANVFRDKRCRTISSIDWTNEKNPKLAISYYESKLNHTDTDSFSTSINNCYIWDIQQETSPLHILQHETACWRLACSPVDPEVLVGGLENGIAAIFDIREGPTAVSMSSRFHSHTCPITGLMFIHTRSNTEFYTGSPDGVCLWWDIRNLSEPTDKVIMSVRIAPKETPTITNAEGVSCIQYERNLPTRFLCGTESGLVINGNRMGKSHNEILTNYWNAHTGPVRALQRSPCTLRMFITCGDYTVRIWSEEVRTAPIIVTSPYQHEVADVVWAPQRFSSYMSVCSGGVFYYWDLLRKYSEPLATLLVSHYPLVKIKPHHEGEIVAVGDSNGSTFLLHLSENMAIPGPRDKPLMSQVYERETKREHIIDSRIKEIHLKKKAEEAAAALAGEEVLEELDDEEQDEEIKEKYFEIVNKELRAIAISQQLE